MSVNILEFYREYKKRVASDRQEELEAKKIVFGLNHVQIEDDNSAKDYDLNDINAAMTASPSEADSPAVDAAPAKMRHILLISASALFLAALLLLSSFESYLLFHSLSEIISICIATAFVIIAWSARDFAKSKFDFVIYICITLFFVSGLDLLHVLTYEGMGVFDSAIFHSGQLWIAARAMQSIGILVGLLLMRRSKHINPHIIVVVFAFVSILLASLIFILRLFPITFIEDSGLTLFKQIGEYVIVSVLIVSVVLLFRIRERFTSFVFRNLLASFLLAAASELCFTAYLDRFVYVDIIGHLLKIAAFYPIYNIVLHTCLRDPYTKIFNDLKSKETKLMESALTDSMTGLYNKRAAMEALEKSIFHTSRTTETLTVCYIDADNLQSIIDNYGSSSGNELLATLGKLLSDNIRASDFACRIGEDEFLLILPNTDIDQATILVKRIREDMLAINRDRRRRWPVNFSYGFAHFIGDNKEIISTDQLLKQADEDLLKYRAARKQSAAITN